LKNQSAANLSKEEFWGRLRDWPDDRANYVFLANAVMAVGKALYPDEWGNFEQLVGYSDADFPEQVGFMVPTMSEDAYKRTKNLVRARERFQHAKKTVAVALADRKLRFALRPVEGGQFIPQRDEDDPWAQGPGSELWNIDNPEFRFSFCQIDLAAPFSGRSRGSHYIFIDRSSLEDFINGPDTDTRGADSMAVANGEQPTSGHGVDLPYLSPYLRVMIDVARELNITPENQPKVDVVEATIRARWGHLPDSNKLITSAATMLREPTSRGKGSGK
jgi:hypothetical protein